MQKEIDIIRDVLKSSIESHELWLVYLKKHPEKEVDHTDATGNTKHHKKCIADYNKALASLKEIENGL